MHFFSDLRRVFTHSQIHRIGFNHFTPYKKFLNCCVSLTDAFRRSWQFFNPPLSGPHRCIDNLIKPHLKDLNLIRCDKNVIEHTQIEPDDLVLEVVDFGSAGKPIMTSSVCAEEFRRFVWFFAPIELNSANGFFVSCPYSPVSSSRFAFYFAVAKLILPFRMFFLWGDRVLEKNPLYLKYLFCKPTYFFRACCASYSLWFLETLAVLRSLQ